MAWEWPASRSGAMWDIYAHNKGAAAVTGRDGAAVFWNHNDNKRLTRAREVVKDVVPAQYGQQLGEKRLVFVATLDCNM